MKTKQHSFKTKTILPKYEVLNPKQRGVLTVDRVAYGISLDILLHSPQPEQGK